MEENNSDIYHDIVLFDGVCILCNHAVSFIINRDKHKRFKFASLQSSFGIEIQKKYCLQTHTMDSLVLFSKNKSYLKSRAALEIAKKLNGLWPIVYIFILVPPPVRNTVYDLLAKYRYNIFGKSESCNYPSDELKERFIEY
ncbi:putative DCC family thiol-disulfide oxidoreductase YuxK [Catalinimonas alkaloidigena]|uniref:thiol-disulfide oxidoreductase DCC family protein n=1 Tax=Catalinimonas alkaloidigena TaxID=1075417 RepID=UPI002405B9E0|nr:DCC1-like thiol-disulfide oxidoreductase family protein [Catalinimonas alkaloidigena]MDF9797544.1 putative DCC family thiol-disulfide oxidoreductase YuxK [Catalinimonas alkaloidigena]